MGNPASPKPSCFSIVVLLTSESNRGARKPSGSNAKEIKKIKKVQITWSSGKENLAPGIKPRYRFPISPQTKLTWRLLETWERARLRVLNTNKISANRKLGTEQPWAGQIKAKLEFLFYSTTSYLEWDVTFGWVLLIGSGNQKYDNYLIEGTGYACAGHNIVMLPLVSAWKARRVSNVGNLGLTLPTGSKENNSKKKCTYKKE